MRLIYLLATLTGLLGLACQIGHALPSVDEISKVVDGKPTVLQGGLAPPNSQLNDDMGNDSRPSTIHGSPTKKHTLHKRGDHLPYSTDTMFETNLDIGNHLIGGTGGGYRQFWACEDGETISQVEAWAGENALIGLKITFAGGIVWSAGTLAGPEGTKYQSFKLQRGENLTGLSIYTNITGDKVAAIRFRTNLRNEGHWLSTNNPNVGPQHTFKVHSGIICGMYGRFGAEIDAIGFNFLKEVESAELHSVQYTNSFNAPSHSVRISEEAMEERNDRDEKETFDFNRLMTLTKSATWKTTDPTGTTSSSFIGAKTLRSGRENSLTVIGKPPTVDLTAESGWSHAFKNSKERISAGTTTKTEPINFPFTVHPHSHVRASAIIVENTLNLRFTGLWTLTFTDGTSHTFELNGSYQGISTKLVSTIVVPVPGSKIPYPITWKKSTPENYPKGRIQGYDKTGEPFYIARRKFNDEIRLGKFGPHHGECITHDSISGEINGSKDFQILEVHPADLLWIPIAGPLKKDPCPNDLVLLPGGHDVKGNTLYIARTQVGGGVNLGYTGFHMSAMECTSWNHKTNAGSVLTTKNYEVLCVAGGYELIEN